MSTVTRFTPPPTVDFDAERFGEACAELAERARPFAPDLVVGIATGGAHVARRMHPYLKGEPHLRIVTLSRPATGVKQRVGLGAVLRHLPTAWNNRLRWFEVEAREGLLRRRGTGSEGPGPSGVTRQGPALPAAERVLIVDDTVDSGRTLATAAGLVRDSLPAAEIRTAVITSTFRNPPLRPDHCLYDRTLIRFPWSFDS